MVQSAVDVDLSYEFFDLMNELFVEKPYQTQIIVQREWLCFDQKSGKEI